MDDNSSEMTDEQLVRDAQAGCYTAFTVLYERYYGYVWQVAYSILKTTDGPDDIAQDVFMTVFRDLLRFRGDAQFSSWLTGITRNKAYSRLRYIINHPTEAPEFLIDLCPSSENPEDCVCDGQERQILCQFISEFSDKLKSVMDLTLAGRTRSQIANELKIPEGTVRSRQQFMYDRLQQKWAQLQTPYEQAESASQD